MSVGRKKRSSTNLQLISNKHQTTDILHRRIAFLCFTPCEAVCAACSNSVAFRQPSFCPWKHLSQEENDHRIRLTYWSPPPREVLPKVAVGRGKPVSIIIHSLRIMLTIAGTYESDWIWCSSERPTLIVHACWPERASLQTQESRPFWSSRSMCHRMICLSTFACGNCSRSRSDDSWFYHIYLNTSNSIRFISIVLFSGLRSCTRLSRVTSQKCST